jgi:hypothetical protein
MVARALVESDIDQGARLLRALDEAAIPIEVAYWFLSPQWSDWWLVVATPLYDERGAHEATQRILTVLRSLDDVDYLMDKIAVVRTDDRWVRALRNATRRSLPKPGYRLGSFYADDLEVLDSYVYRLLPRADDAANGTAPRRRTSRNGTTSTRKAPVKSEA